MNSTPETGARHSSTTVLGVLGGIAAGKSTVARVLAGADGVVLSADEAAHRALESQDLRARLVERFGPDILGSPSDGSPSLGAPSLGSPADGSPATGSPATGGLGEVDRAALARLVFDDPEARKALEGWIHPVVRATLHASFEDARRRGVPIVVLDVPLLLENAGEHGLLELCDHLVFVDAPLAARDMRAVRDRGWDPGEVARREATQMPLSTKRTRADVVIRNDGDQEALENATRQALRTLADR